MYTYVPDISAARPADASPKGPRVHSSTEIYGIFPGSESWSRESISSAIGAAYVEVIQKAPLSSQQGNTVPDGIHESPPDF
jgi:hypothetical protein